MNESGVAVEESRGERLADGLYLLKVVASVQRKAPQPRLCPGDENCTNAGQRHDDITYQSIAKAFGLKLKLYEEAYERMKKFSKSHPSQPAFSWDEDSPVKTARLRMVELPTDETIPLEKQFIFPREDMWVPVAVANGNVHILPGIPHLCKSASTGTSSSRLLLSATTQLRGCWTV